MLVTAAVGMTTKFVEVTLSHKYREKAEDGSMAGGPMYFMKNKLNMGWLAAIFCGSHSAFVLWYWKFAPDQQYLQYSLFNFRCQ